MDEIDYRKSVSTNWSAPLLSRSRIFVIKPENRVNKPPKWEYHPPKRTESAPGSVTVIPIEKPSVEGAKSQEKTKKAAKVKKIEEMNKTVDNADK